MKKTRLTGFYYKDYDKSRLKKRLNKHLLDLNIKTEKSYIEKKNRLGFKNNFKDKGKNELDWERYLFSLSSISNRDISIEFYLKKFRKIPNLSKSSFPEFSLSNWNLRKDNVLANKLKLKIQKKEIEIPTFLNNFYSKISHLKWEKESDDLIFVKRVLKFNDFFLKDLENIKKIKSKNKDKNKKNIINELFVKYRDYNASFLFKFWTLDGDNIFEKNGYKFHFDIIQGKSILKSFKSNFGNFLKRNSEIPLFLSSKKNNYKEALLEVLLKRNNLSKKFNDLKFLINFDSFFKDPKVDIFLNLISKDNMLDSSQYGPIWDYIIENNIELMRKRSLHKLYAEMLQWHKDLGLSKNFKLIFWNIGDIPNYEYSKKRKINDKKEILVKYKISEILSNKELRDEGRDLKHCVFSYEKKIKNKICRIYSLKVIEEGKSKRLLTIEVKGDSIIQVRGKRNRLQTNEERSIIMSWALKNNLTYL